MTINTKPIDMRHPAEPCPAMTVGDLVAALARFPADTPTCVAYGRGVSPLVRAVTQKGCVSLVSEDVCQDLHRLLGG